jgi:hypothetical protein
VCDGGGVDGVGVRGGGVDGRGCEGDGVDLDVEPPRCFDPCRNATGASRVTTRRRRDRFACETTLPSGPSGSATAGARPCASPGFGPPTNGPSGVESTRPISANTAIAVATTTAKPTRSVRFMPSPTSADSVSWRG